jgi:hypothetical protein
MSKANSDFTAIVKDDSGVHILKCKIIDEQHLIFQMLNTTKDTLTPQFKIKADFGMLKYIKPNKWQKEFEESKKFTKNVNRNSLIGYYNQFKLMALVGVYHS